MQYEYPHKKYIGHVVYDCAKKGIQNAATECDGMLIPPLLPPPPSPPSPQDRKMQPSVSIDLHKIDLKMMVGKMIFIVRCRFLA